ncbi:hypothetical protein KUCAC02_028812 [Chaenocephalus aceratus]|uniref:Uncharacterized protein n=1 Tax=Chaenocephalus aceratus TaxID=36190 RepID=A0ACB9X2W1_CHAAC|nr:hypothetical protein KUCAC02_028812 [Chaenocephalus aceratus]
MCGLCGNYNKNNGDDFRRPGGRKTTSVDDFGKSWVVDMPGNVCGGQCPVCEQAKATLYGKSDSCGFMSAPNGPFKACHSKVDPVAYVSNCVFDVCAVGGNKDDLCNSVQAYALACQSENPAMEKQLLLPCGCVHNGRYLTMSQAVVDKAGTSKCVCQASGVVNCEKLTCASGEVCGGRDGVGGCHVKQGYCSVSQVGLRTSFDGMSGAIGAQGVNGSKVSLPSKVTSDGSVRISEKTVIIEKASAVRLTYSLSKEVTVIIDSSLSGKMCGACGNYNNNNNNNSKDDMRTADGENHH